RRGARRAQVQFGLWHRAGEPGQVPSPVDDPARRGGQAGDHRGPEALPGGVLVTGPDDAVGLGTGEAGPGEGDGCLTLGAQQVAEGAGVVHRVAVVALVPVRAARVPQVVAPGVLATVGLEAVDVEVPHQVAALAGPPFA